MRGQKLKLHKTQVKMSVNSVNLFYKDAYLQMTFAGKNSINKNVVIAAQG
jgi:hypothetical protein